MQGRLIFNNGVRLANVVLHWQIPVGLTVDVTLANAIMTALSTQWGAHLAAFCKTTTGFGAVALRDLRNASAAEVVSTSAAVQGTDTTDNLPLSIAAVVTLRTAKAGRSFRGRSYLPMFTEAANGPNGHMLATFKTQLDAFATAMLTAANQSGAQLAVLSRPTTFDPDTGLPIAPGLGFVTPVTQILARDDVWDSQRRRNQ
jgi:hypothetical protein